MAEDTVPVLASSPADLATTVLAGDHRVLLAGQPGIGKSTLVNGLAEALDRAGRECWCIGADPGSPLFGIPGAVCLGQWIGGGWETKSTEALCTLDAGRFRLPLLLAVRRLAESTRSGVVLVDGPGVVRGVSGAELLTAIAEVAAIDTVLMLAREGRPLPLERELLALPAKVYRIPAAPAARRPGKGTRAKRRTALWDAYMGTPTTRQLDLEQLPLLGTPPPVHEPAAWRGRQIALLDGMHTTAMGEVVNLDGNVLHVKLPRACPRPTAILVRDAARLADGRVGTVEPFSTEPLQYVPAPEMAPPPGYYASGPRIAGRVGVADITLVNGVLGDPLLHLRLRHQRRSVLFDLGEGARLSARIAHQVTDVFISHAHVDHIGGFLWLLRSRIGDFPTCRMYGPPGLAANIAGLTRGILWDRVGDRGPRFEVSELHRDHLKKYAVQAGYPDPQLLEERPAKGGVLWSERAFRVRAATLDHSSPVLAYAFEPARQLNVRKDRLQARGLEPGPWLGHLKRCIRSERTDMPIELPDGRQEQAQALADDLLLVTAGKKLAYATDFADTVDNRRRLVELARGAHTFFCEASFLEADRDQAIRTAHLTTRACGEIAEDAGVSRLAPFHFSRRYEHDISALYQEIAEVCSRVAVPDSMTLGVQ